MIAEKPKKQGESSDPECGKMLIFLQSGEQRLVTFTLPSNHCTLQEILEKVEIPHTANSFVQIVQSTPNGSIDYFVAVDCAAKIEEMIEEHQHFYADVRNTRKRHSRK